MNTGDYKEQLYEAFIFETEQILEQVEQVILTCEKDGEYGEEAINEVFRLTHTIKGSSAMMFYEHISSLAHSVEDLFFFLREEKPIEIDASKLTDILLDSIDFISSAINKIKSGEEEQENPSDLIKHNREYLNLIKNSDEIQMPLEESSFYKISFFYENGWGMEEIRAYQVVLDLIRKVEDVIYFPKELMNNSESAQVIQEQGFLIYIKTTWQLEEVEKYFNKVALIEKLIIHKISKIEFEALQNEGKESSFNIEAVEEACTENSITMSKEAVASSHQNKGIISVHVEKLDKLMDLMGEIVLSEAMVTQNVDLKNLELDNFQKAARQHRKNISELQDMVMAIRMVPLSATFQKMNRILRDISKKLDKLAQLEIIGEDTEVDKNIIEHISDPLMHMVRNAIDHGLETSTEREAKGKTEPAKVTLEARNEGGDVIIVVKDNGRGLDKEKIIEKAKESGVLTRPANEMVDREIYSLIFIPGFSTNDIVTEFSGRGVGMDVVTKNIEVIGGHVFVDSAPDVGTAITIKIPLTLAIVEGMIIQVGNSRYTIPIISIMESFRASREEIVVDPEHNEMIMVRGKCYPIIRLHQIFGVKDARVNIDEGILIMVENDNGSFCIFADELLGDQQVVIKPLPQYIRGFKAIKGLSGCTLLGDGSISLILDIGNLG